MKFESLFLNIQFSWPWLWFEFELNCKLYFQFIKRMKTILWFPIFSLLYNQRIVLFLVSPEWQNLKLIITKNNTHCLHNEFIFSFCLCLVIEYLNQITWVCKLEPEFGFLLLYIDFDLVESISINFRLNTIIIIILK